MKNSKKMLMMIFSVGLCGFCLLFPGSVKAAASGGINRCISVIIPSLYAMMTASAILMKSGTISGMGRFIDPVSRKIFGINGELTAILFFSLIAGYPVGAKMIVTLYRENRISKKAAEIMAGLCFGSGTAFIFGCAASSAAVGRLLLLSTVTADILIVLIMSPWLRKNCGVGEIPHKADFSADLLTECTISAGRSIAEICFCVVIFSVISQMLTDSGVLRFFGSIDFVRAFLDVTALSGTSLSLPYAAGLLSFGGICVFLQITAIFKGELSALPLAVIRAAAALLSGILCRLFFPIFIENSTVDVFSSDWELHREVSPIPSIMLILMTAMLIAEQKMPWKIKKRT